MLCCHSRNEVKSVSRHVYNRKSSRQRHLSTTKTYGVTACHVRRRQSWKDSLKNTCRATLAMAVSKNIWVCDWKAHLNSFSFFVYCIWQWLLHGLLDSLVSICRNRMMLHAYAGLCRIGGMTVTVHFITGTNATYRSLGSEIETGRCGGSLSSQPDFCSSSDCIVSKCLDPHSRSYECTRVSVQTGSGWLL